MTSGAVAADAPRSGAGRPRDERKTPQILRAVLDLIIQVGYQALRVEAVAAQAGVSPGSVYRRWPTKQDLVIAALDWSPDPLPLEGTGDAGRDLSTLLTELTQRLAEPGHSHLALLAADPNEPEVARAARRRIRRLYRYLRSLLAARFGADHPALDLIADAGLALIWYRVLVIGERVDAARLVDELNRNVLDHLAEQRPPSVASGHPAGPAGVRKDVVRNRHRIITAAGELFAERPYEEVQLSEIAERAGVSRATLVRRMGTKRQVLIEVHKRRLHAIVDLCARAVAETDPWHGVELVLRTMTEWASHDGGMHAILRGIDPLDDDEWPELAARVFAALDEVLDRARRAGSLRAGVSAVDVYPLVSASLTASGVPGTNPRLYTDILLQGLRAPSDGRTP